MQAQSFRESFRALLDTEPFSAIRERFLAKKNPFKDIRFPRYIAETVASLAAAPDTKPLADTIVALAEKCNFAIHHQKRPRDNNENDLGVGMSISPDDTLAFIAALPSGPHPRTFAAIIPHAIINDALRVRIISAASSSPAEYPLSRLIRARIVVYACTFLAEVMFDAPHAMLAQDSAIELQGPLYLAGLQEYETSFDACALLIMHEANPAGHAILANFVRSWVAAIGIHLWVAVAAARGITPPTQHQATACSVALLAYIQICAAFDFLDTCPPNPPFVFQ